MRKPYKVLLSIALVAGVMSLLMGAGIMLNTNLVGVGYKCWEAGVAADTLKFPIQAVTGARPVILGGSILVGSTAHKTYFLQCIATTKLESTMTATVCTSFVVHDTTMDAAGNVTAAGDVFIIQNNDGTPHMVQCSVYTAGSKHIKFRVEEVGTKAANAGNPVWVMGAIAEANTQYYQLTASSLNSYPQEAICGLIGRPIAVMSPCVTKADTLGYMSWGYINK